MSGGVWRTHSTQLKNHTKQCGKEERSGVEQMRSGVVMEQSEKGEVGWLSRERKIDGFYRNADK